MRMSIGAKLISGFLFLVGLLVVVSVVGYRSLQQVGEKAAELQTAAQARHESDAFGLLLVRQQDALTDYALTGEDSSRKSAQELETLANRQEATIAKVTDDPKMAGIVREIGKIHDGFQSQGERMAALYLHGNKSEAQAAMDSFDRTTEAVGQMIAELEKHNETMMVQTREQMRRSQSRAGIVIITVAVGAVIAGILLGVLLARSISVPVNKIARVAERVAGGDLSVEVDISRGDEIGSLADSFRKMSAYLRETAVVAEQIAQGDLRATVRPKSEKDVLGNAFKMMLANLRGIVTSIHGGAEQMASASAQIAATSEQTARNNETTAAAVEETTSTMHEMSANIQNVAKNSQSQASSVTQTSASVEQMAASILRIANTVQKFAALSQDSRTAVAGGLEAVDNSEKGMDEINSAIERSAVTIAALGGRVEDIGRIVDVIDEIAEQTNLLALNAAIEAARAGEHGLGFAVVADEVRKLAERSGKSTKEIAELIGGIQKEALAAVKLMEKSTQLVQRGVEKGKQVGTALATIEGQVMEVDKYSREISAATQEQSSGSTQIAKATENLREVTHEISAAADEQAAAAELIVKTMEKMRNMVHQNASGTAELASSAEQMRSQADRFLAIVSQFQLGDNGGGDQGSLAAARNKALRSAVGAAETTKSSGRELQAVA